MSQTYSGNNAAAGGSAVYKNVAQLADGTPISCRMILVSKSDPNMTVDLTGGSGYEILMNGNGTGETASLKFEFFNPLIGDLVTLNSTATFNNLDRNSPGDQEAVTLIRKASRPLAMRQIHPWLCPRDRKL